MCDCACGRVWACEDPACPNDECRECRDEHEATAEADAALADEEARAEANAAQFFDRR